MNGFRPVATEFLGAFHGRSVAGVFDGDERELGHRGPRLARLAGGVHRLDGQLMVVLDVDRVLDLATKTISLVA